MARSKQGVRSDREGTPESRRGEGGLGSWDDRPVGGLWTGLGSRYFPGCWDPQRRLVDTLAVQAPEADCGRRGSVPCC